ncbi:MAG: carboxypeptidase-like regulatory domain-containing protein, partial [Saprospiraceae bacterium]|nr:carboxypeptidase-like regulatory domain-containing protein [Saprospiraceae bacterium]
FLNEPNQFVDHMHFMGNQTHIGNPQNYTRRFLILPYYTHSTEKEFIQLHVQHHFKGALLGKLPLFKQLGWQLSGGFKYLNTGSQDPYREFHVGLDNIGWKVFRLFRVDAVWNNWDNNIEIPSEGTSFGVVIGIGLDL